MLGAVLVAIAIVVVIPVSIMMSGSVIAAVMGWLLKDDADARNAGSELIDLNR